jgi:uncharacterized membrane protein YfcA
MSGLLGVGGGTVLVPALIFVLPTLGVSGADLPKIAMATSLAIIVPTSIASAQAHHLKGAIEWRFLALLVPGIMIGALIASILASAVNATLLIAVFVVFALYSAWAIVRGAGPRTSDPTSSSCHVQFSAILKGFLGSVLSSLIGLGVTWVTTPILSRFMGMAHAIGTSTALCVPMALVGVIGYLIAPPPAQCLSVCAGYVHLPAVAAVGISAVLAAPMGARLTHSLPVIFLRRLFGLFLFSAAATLAYKSLPLPAMAQNAYRLSLQLLSPPSANRPLAAAMPDWLSCRPQLSVAQLVQLYRSDRRHLPLTPQPSYCTDLPGLFFLMPAPSGTGFPRELPGEPDSKTIHSVQRLVLRPVPPPPSRRKVPQ